MNRGAARTLVEQATGRVDKTALINSALDLGVSKVSTARLWSQLKVTASLTLALGTSSIALSSDATRVTQFRVRDGTASYKLAIRAQEWVKQRWPLTSSMTDAKPAYGYLVGKTLHVVPEADVEYTIDYDYYRLHPPLAEDSDLLLIDAADAAVIAYASFWTWLSLEQPENAAAWKATFDDELRDAISADKASATEIFLMPHNETVAVQPDFFLDPFVKHSP